MVILYYKRLSESNLHLNPDLISNKDLNQGCRLCVASFLLLIKTSLCFVRVFEGAVEIQGRQAKFPDWFKPLLLWPRKLH